MIYLTFYAKQKPHQVTFEELLLNPYMKLSSLPRQDLKKVTVQVTEDYGKELYTKLNANTFILNEQDLTNLNTAEHYRHFEIPKKSDPSKKRPIDAPDDYLSEIQNFYKTYLEKTLSVLPHKAAHAYVAKRSTITAMQKHQANHSKWFLQIDLKNFFNSINEEFLKRMLLSVYPFPYIPETTFNNIVKCSLLNGTLPQGSHLSPTLTNLLMVPIDHEITEKIHNYIGSNGTHHYVYTRYADDITISSKEKFNPREIEEVIRNIFNSFNVPFRINEEKTRFGSTAGRNYHIGLILNKDNKISVGHEKNNKFKAMIFNFCTTGEEWDVKDVYKMLGLISYYKAIEPDFVNKILNKYGQKFNMDILAKAKMLTTQPAYAATVVIPEAEVEYTAYDGALPF